MTHPTEEQREMVLKSLGVGCNLVESARAAGTTAAACKALAQVDEEWAAAMAGAAPVEAEGPAPTVSFNDLFDRSREIERERAEDAAAKMATESLAPIHVRRVAPVEHDPETGEVHDEAPHVIDDDEAPELETLRLHAASYGPGAFGFLQLVNARCEAAKLHPMDPWWVNHFRKFYASGKMIDIGRVGLRGGKSTNVCRALVADVLYTRRVLEPSQIGVCPIMSDRKSTRLNSSHSDRSRMPSSA